MKDKMTEMIIDYYKTTVGVTINEDMVFIVWTCKTLQNYKSILATSHSDQRLFEITYNGDKNEFYLDVYAKERNFVVIP